MDKIETIKNQKFFDAICSGDIELYKKFISEGFDVNCRYKYGYTALMLVDSCDNCIELTRELLKHPQIDVNIIDEKGWTALMWACCRNVTAIVKELLKNPCIDINARSENQNNMAYDLAKMNNNKEIMLLLKLKKLHKTLIKNGK